MGQGKDSVPNIGDNPFVKGNLGTRSAMRRVLRAAIQKIELSPERGVIAIIGGAGHTGKNIVLDAVRLKAAQTVIAFDPQYDTTKVETLDGVNVVYTADKQVLNGADLVMIFTRSGDDIRGLQGCFKKGALLVDDTHPYCSASVRKLFPGVTFLKAMLTVEGFSFLTGLPGFKGKGVPGCLFEALVYLEYEQAWGGSIDLETFDSFADRLNPEAMLIEHPR
jgi:predicted amino acid dehydrogenase